MKIYLAGGMRERPVTVSQMFETPVIGGSKTFTHWQDAVKWVMRFPHEFFDPRDSNTKEFADYSFLDVMALRQCDLVVAYLEEENPYGQGLIAECAFAKGLGKTVFLINGQHADRYVKFVENFADRVFYTLQDAVPLLEKIR